MAMQTAGSPWSNGNVLYGTFASRPAPGVAGRTFIPTNGYYPCRDTGGAWVTQAIPGIDCVNPPAAGTWTVVNSGSECTLAADGDGLLVTLMGTGSGTQKNTAFLTALPGGAYSLVIGFEVCWLMPLTASYFAPILADGTGTNNKHTEFQYVFTADVGPRINLAKFSAISTDAGSPYFTGTDTTNPFGIFFMRIRDDATLRHYELSRDLRNWDHLYQVSRTDYLTPTHGGFLVGQATTSVLTTDTRVRVKIFHWSLG